MFPLFISLVTDKTLSVVAITLSVLVLGWFLPSAYLVLEDLLFRAMLGPPLISARLRRIAREDFALLVDQYERDRGVTKHVARAVAVFFRLCHLYRLLRELRDIRREKEVDVYRGLIIRMRYAWLDGLQTSIILDQMNILKRLRPPSEGDLDLEAAALIANLTYLLGKLKNGRQLAEQNMKEAKDRDGKGIPKNQWRAAYAYCNSQLFLGHFDDAAKELGERWINNYEPLDHDIRRKLHEEFRLLLLDPIASVPRHMILAAAFKGKPILTDVTWQSLYNVPNDLPPAEQWVEGWYTAGKALCERSEIGLYFTHAYIALYRTTVPSDLPHDEVLTILDEIPPTARIVSLYAKHAVRGIYHFSKSLPNDPDDPNLKAALADLRAADAYSRMSGNRFLEGVLLPVYAAATARSGIYGRPETLRILARARQHADLSRNTFYNTLIIAARAILAYQESDRAKFVQLRRRAENYEKEMSYGLVRIFRLREHE